MQTLDVINAALANLKEQSIMSLTDDTEVARIVNNIYNISKIDFLSDICIWDCAKNTVKLTRLEETDELNRFDYVYILPNTPEIIEILNIANSTLEFSIYNNIYNREALNTTQKYDRRNGKLYTSTSECWIEYIGNIEVSKFDSFMLQAFVYKLCYELAYPITSSVSLQDRFYELYKRNLKKARSTNAITKNQYLYTNDTYITRI